MSISAFQSARNMALAMIAVCGPLTHHFDVLAAKYRRSQPAPQMNRRWIVWAACALLVFQGGLFSNRLVRDEPYPEGAVEFLDARKMHGNVLSDFAWGQYLIWHLPPQDKIFIDGRNDTVYPAEVVRNYLLFHFGMPAGNYLLNAYPHDFVLIPPRAPARRLMDKRGDWKIIYRDPDAVLYARTGALPASMAGAPTIGSSSSPGGFP
jgi:hypothetical protein